MEEGTVQYWVHDLNPIIFQFTETLAVRWYGLAYVTGFLVAFGLLGMYWKRGRSALNPRMQESLSMALILGVVVGGRLGYFFLYEPGTLMADPLALFRVWTGGMASHGGFVGVALAVFWVARKYQLNPLYIGDLIASVAAQGLFLGRIANFIRGELWGKVTEVPWAVIFPESAPPGTPVWMIPPRHPSQLYEAALEGLFLFIYMQVRFWMIRGRRPTPTAETPPSARPGHLTGEFLVFYSVGRVLAEAFREPDASLILGLSRGSFYSFFLFLAGVILIVATRKGWLTISRSR